GVPVSTIAYGTDRGYVILEGRRVDVPVNREALAVLAEATGGKAFEATSARELKDAYRDIGSSIGYSTQKREVSRWFVGVALSLALAAACFSLLWFSRLP
ncbi:MAG: VWA domain-containing protein, partial [Acidimicrobiales bacterium]